MPKPARLETFCHCRDLFYSFTVQEDNRRARAPLPFSFPLCSTAPLTHGFKIFSQQRKREPWSLFRQADDCMDHSRLSISLKAVIIMLFSLSNLSKHALRFILCTIHVSAFDA